MMAEPQKEHQWLQKLVVDWTFESECNMGPDQPKEKFKGSETVRSLGGMWFVGEGKGEMPGGGTGNMMVTLGYDAAKKCYVGSWVGTMMSNMWVYEGQLDASGKVLTLSTEGPSCTGEGYAKYQDIIEFKSDDVRTLTSRTQGPDGKWTPFMVATYRRTR